MTAKRTGFPLAIPPGDFRIPAALDDRLRQAAGAPDRRGSCAFPGLAFVLALGGAGRTIAETLEDAGYSIDDSPLLAACAIELDEPLRIETDYRIYGQVIDAIRKPSRRFGAADHLRLRYDISRDGGRRTGSLTLTMVIGAGDE